MKKRVMAIALAGLLCASAAGLASCGEKKTDNELWITYFKGGYGSEWVEQLARKFEAENEGVTVRTDGDTQLIDSVANMMQNGTDYDLIFCHDITGKNLKPKIRKKSEGKLRKQHWQKRRTIWEAQLPIPK